MKAILYLITFITFVSNGQSLRDINFRYFYSNEQSASLRIRPVRESSGWKCYYKIIQKDSTQKSDSYSIDWEVRKSLSDAAGTKVTVDSANTSQPYVTVPASEELQFLVGKLRSINEKTLTFYYSPLEPRYPERELLYRDGKPLLDMYSKVHSSLSIAGNGTYTVSYYNDNFPTAPLAFSEALGKVSRQMKVDSTFVIEGNQGVTLEKTGLYLFQKDTTSAEGTAIRIEDDYPRFTKLNSIADPLVYICTNQEYSKIKQSKGEKKAFDKVILSITQDSQRAKKMMRSYFQRVELANRFFTSYKEGWKTDRGMIYIIFGVPDEVFRYSDREVWNYKESVPKVKFEFVRSPSIFDPGNYVLIRDKKYTETWYEVVDLWRNARY